MEKYFSVNEKGYSIRCKIYCNDMRGIRDIVLCGHGFAGHKDNSAAQKFSNKMLSKRKATAVVTFNWPCHGDDARKSLRLGECDFYLTTVLDYLRKRFNPEHLFGYATSFGGFLFLKYISEHGNPFDRMALRCPAVRMSDSLRKTIMTDGELESIMSGKPVLVGFDRKIKIDSKFLDEVKNVDLFALDFTPFKDYILILHGTKDEVVSFEDGKSFAAKNSLTFIASENADHRYKNTDLMDLAISQIIKYFYK